MLKNEKIFLTLKEQDKLQDYFEEYKKKIINLRNILDKTNDEVNYLVYKMYDLHKKEIRTMEENVPI